MRRDRRESNPIFSDRKLKLGTLQTNLDSGCVMSDLDGRLDISWPNTVALAQLADEMEFEALVPVARWRGFGGATNPQGPGFEAFAWAAGIGALTRTSGVVSSSHTPFNHPIIAAKQSTVIDHITNGRFVLNVVTGWNKPEFDMFGVRLLPHAERFAVAEEWIEIVRRLWSEDEPLDFEGKHYRISKGYLAPKPIQAPYPALMNAGSSQRGRHFAAKHCDLAFTIVRGGGDIADYADHVQAYHAVAREYGREIKVWTLVNIVQGETEKDADAFYDYYVNERGDWEAARNRVELAAIHLNARNLRPEQKEAMLELTIAGWGGYTLKGTKEQIVDGLVALSRTGLDGVLLCWPRFEQGMREFREVTYPLVKQAGLRDFG